MLQNQPKPSNLRVGNLFKKQQKHFENLDPEQITNCIEPAEIYEYHNFLPKDLCKQLIEITEKEGYADAPITVGYGQAVMDKSYRNSERVMFDDIETAQFLFKYVKDLAPICSEGAYLHSINERLRFLKYDVGGIFKQHCDGRYPASQTCMSMYTIHFYLNDVKEGGGTSFYYFNLDQNSKLQNHKIIVDSVSGKLAVFRQNAIEHMGDKVLKGLKYTVRTELMYKYLTDQEIQQIKDEKCGICKSGVEVIPFKRCKHSFVKCKCPMYCSLNGGDKDQERQPKCYVCKEEKDYKSLY